MDNNKELRKRMRQLNADNFKLTGSVNELSKVVVALQDAMGKNNATKTAEESLKIFVEWLRNEAHEKALEQMSLKGEMNELRSLLEL